MRKILITVAVLLAACSTIPSMVGQEPGLESLVFTVKNPTNLARVEEPILLNIDSLSRRLPDFKPENYILTTGNQVLPFQVVDRNMNGEYDHLLLLISLAANGAIDITVKKGTLPDIANRVQAELSVKEGGEFVDRVYQGGSFKNVTSLVVPPEHTDHSFFIRYEGPGWESDKVGYRFYLDWRNAIDIFGKKSPDLVLQDVGQDGFDSYHELSDWGMDILKVGESLGIGSIGMWHAGAVNRVSKTGRVTCDIKSNGPLEASILTSYRDWKVGESDYQLKSHLMIQAGSRLTRHCLSIDPVPENLCTGIVKHPGTVLINGPAGESDWEFMATYGPQSLAEDNLGMAVIYQRRHLIEKKSDKHSEIVLLKPIRGKLTYYFLAAWEGEQDGIKNISEFRDYLNETIEKLNNPVIVKLSY